jgi:hypothetical protein
VDSRKQLLKKSHLYIRRNIGGTNEKRLTQHQPHIL